MRWLFGVVMLVSSVILVACGGDDGDSDDDLPLPTLAASVVTDTPEPTDTEPPTSTPTVTATATDTQPPTLTPTITPTLIPSETSPPTLTFTPSPVPTRFFSATTVGNLPVYSTLTPAPGGNVPATPVIAADIVVTEQEFQDVVNQLIPTTPSIESAVIDFIPGENQGIRVRLTAPGGEAMITGDVFVSFRMSGDFVTITVADITIAGNAAPESYVTVATEELYPIIVDAFRMVLSERLGEEHDLEVLFFSDNAMEITLLVPEGSQGN